MTNNRPQALRWCKTRAKPTQPWIRPRACSQWYIPSLWHQTKQKVFTALLLEVRFTMKDNWCRMIGIIVGNCPNWFVRVQEPAPADVPSRIRFWTNWLQKRENWIHRGHWKVYKSQSCMYWQEGYMNHLQSGRVRTLKMISSSNPCSLSNGCQSALSRTSSGMDLRK